MSADIHKHNSRLQATSITIPSDFVFGKVRSLQEYNSTMCSICRDARVVADRVPDYPVGEGLPPNVTCGEWEYIAQTSMTAEACESEGIRSFYWQCCDGGVPFYKCESNIRKKLLEDYDPAVPPILSAQTPLNVSVTVEVFAVEKIDVQGGTAKILCSVYLEWKDERLKWEQEDETCAGYVSMYAGADREKTEVWVPDIDLLNQVEGMQTLPDTAALVFSDGTVHWSRNGGITAFCQFAGLSQIPFDVLGCQFIVGPYVRRDPSLISYQLFNGTGLLQGKFEPTFNEYLPVPELSESGTAFDGVVLYFNLFYRRSQKYYVNNLLIPTIILTYVSMGTFLLDLRVGERLSYGMALTLVVVAQQIATGGSIPISNERLWIDKFIGWSFYWVIVGLVESVIIGYIYFLREDKAAQLSPEGGNRIYDGMRESVFAAQPPAHNHQEEDNKNRVRQNMDFSSSTNWSSPHLREGEVDCDNYASHLEERKTRPTIASKTIPQQEQSTGEIDGQRRFTTFKQQLGKNQSQRSLGETTSGQWYPKEEKREYGMWKFVYTVSLRKIDRFFFFFTLVTYTLFVIAMFVSRPYWGQNLKNVWLHQGDTSWDSEVEIRGTGQ
ncbi:receptor subunit alpha-type acr-16 [Seminavis robusta]|uniref:Receptor subunit alpha-type acr-16 n=1 Tax=Seminavis robusta TaxID=568900 RepID=A0A9N8DWB0_9STRA|nr:receptor subunit alpha-type acr-16 [Seminavis robusta]|eukprot:Sro400_g135090.1 receptor subunit alpha-type acr-16 (609) ;mRNA; f:27465-29386